MYLSINLYLVISPDELRQTLIHTSQYNFVYRCNWKVLKVFKKSM